MKPSHASPNPPADSSHDLSKISNARDRLARAKKLRVRHRRLAADAIYQDDAPAMRRLLASGLSANGEIHESGYSEHGPLSLLEVAARDDAVSCFLALLGAGATLTPNAIDFAFAGRRGGAGSDGGQCRVLRTLFASGRVDPSGVVFHGVTALAWANATERPEAIEAVLNAQAAREAAAIDACLAPTAAAASAGRPKRRL